MRPSIALGSLLLITAALVGCDDEDRHHPTGAGGSGATGASGGHAGQGGSGGGEPVCEEPAANPNARQVDLLVMVDNSRSMRDKQQVLADGIQELVGVFSNPRCVDGDGLVVGEQPAHPADPCPAGSERMIDPVVDLHIGVLSSSIGGHGSDACVGDGSPTENDQAHLIVRADGGGTVSTWDDKGFLVWDPAQALVPEGACNQGALAGDLESMILGAGEVGCGFEAQLESWYRFLIDPDPYASIEVENGSAVLTGTDAALLAQRAAFLRPDSVLVVMMLSDENDCSTRDGGQFFFANQNYQPSSNNPYHLPKPRAACAIDPNDPCCRSCGQTPGIGCDTTQDDCSAALSAEQDPVNLRCFDQKRRFGIDFMWPVDRYATGLTSPQVPDRQGQLVQNPIFAEGRSPSDVFLGGIVGVPWQDIARRNAGGDPDLDSGLDGSGNPVGGLQSAAELAALGTWDVILGDPASYVAPTDPLMIESRGPRSGNNPITGDALAPPGAGTLANPINGHEYGDASQADLQYACVFELPEARDCSAMQTSCECEVISDSPLCQDPGGDYGTTQYFAKAHPSRRQLSVLKALGSQAVVGSICPASLDDPASRSYGYRPAVGALAEAVQGALTLR